jgi:hypothetical protein
MISICPLAAAGWPAPPFGPSTARPCIRRRGRHSGRRAPCRSCSDSLYRPGRSRQWRKAKHKMVETLQVAGWRPSTPGRPGGMLLADNGEPIGLAPSPCLKASAPGSSTCWDGTGDTIRLGRSPSPRTASRPSCTTRRAAPTLGHLREAFVVCIEPAHDAVLSST